MSSTAHEDQYTTAPEPLHQPYDTATILRQNIADAEKELQRQAERAESYAETLRSIASYVGAGGCNADTVDAGVFEEKIRWGIGEIQDRLAGAIERELVNRSSLITARNDIQTWIDSRNKWMARAEAAEAELAKLAQQEPVAWKHENGNLFLFLSWQKDLIVTGAKFSPLYAAPVPVSAVPTDEQIHAAYRNALGQSIRERDMPEIRKFAHALLQSSEVMM